MSVSRTIQGVKQSKTSSKALKGSSKIHSTKKSDSPIKKPTVGIEKVKNDTRKTQLSKQERRALRLKSKKHSQIVKKILPLWEILRRDDTEHEKKMDLIDNIIKICQGKMSDLCFAHDTARIMESVVQHGTELHRWTVFAELKRTLRLMAKSRYAKFVLVKLIKYGAKEHRLEILKRFKGHVARLVSHRIASELVDMMYNDYANATQRCALMQELYGNVHALQLAENQVASLKDTLIRHPDKRQTILSNVNALLVNLASKGLCKYSIVQHLLLEYLQIIYEILKVKDSANSETAIMQQLTHVDSFNSLCEALVDNQVVPMLHTREGVRAALYLLWLLSPRLRKQLIRGLKTCVASVARNEHGHLFLIGVLDCVDDIVLLKKIIIKEVLEDLRLFCVHPECRKVLLYALSPRDTRHFSPQLQASLMHPGDFSPHTKKSLGLRALELRNPSTTLIPRLLQLVVTNLTDVFVGDSSAEGRVAFQDRGRLILLSEILIRSAPHHQDPVYVLSAYKRLTTIANDTPANPDESLPPAEPSACDQLDKLRRKALSQIVRQLLAPVFVPTGQSALGKRVCSSRDEERVKRHKRAVLLVEQTISAAGKPNFPMFDSNTMEVESEGDDHEAISADHSSTVAIHMPFLERPEGTLFMKRLLHDGRVNKDYSFAHLILKHVSPSNLQAWTRCNRSCFVLVNLYEMGDSATCQLIRSALTPCLTELQMSSLSGAKVLYKHLESTQ